MPCRFAAVPRVAPPQRAGWRPRRGRTPLARSPCGKVAEVDLRLLPQQQLKVTPKQIAANYILQLSSLELQDVINQELQENPALDLEEVQACPLCGQPLAGRVSLNCFGTGKGPYKGGDDRETEVLKTIQGIEPWGIGARDTRECLLIQIDHLAEIGEEIPPHARAIVADHLRELGEHKFGDIAQALRISREDVQHGWDWVKQSLNP